MWDPDKARHKLPTPSSKQRAILDAASVSVSIPKYSDKTEDIWTETKDDLVINMMT